MIFFLIIKCKFTAESATYNFRMGLEYWATEVLLVTLVLKLDFGLLSLTYVRRTKTRIIPKFICA